MFLSRISRLTIRHRPFQNRRIVLILFLTQTCDHAIKTVTMAYDSAMTTPAFENPPESRPDVTCGTQRFAKAEKTGRLLTRVAFIASSAWMLAQAPWNETGRSATTCPGCRPTLPENPASTPSGGVRQASAAPRGHKAGRAPSAPESVSRSRPRAAVGPRPRCAMLSPRSRATFMMWASIVDARHT